MAKPASTSALSRPNGCRMLDRFQTSKLLRTSTITHNIAPKESKRMRWERAVNAKEPEALQSV